MPTSSPNYITASRLPLATRRGCVVVAEEEKKMLYALFLLASCYVFLFTIFAGHRDLGALILAQNTTVSVDVGVILDLELLMGKKCLTSISMAVEDFYAVHGNYSTRVVLHVKDAKQGAVGAAAAAVDLLKNVGVSCIVGPPTSTEAAFVISLGGRTNVPVLSFSASSPTLSPLHNPFFVRTTTTDSAQVEAISALVRYFNWRQAVPVYSDSDFGTGIVPSLIAALQSAGARVPYRGVIPALASDSQLDQELLRLKALPARVFIVHALPKLVLRLFQRATDLGMMTRGYAWITSDGVSGVLDLFDQKKMVGAMRGVIGVRPWVNRSREEVTNFTARFGWRIRRVNLKGKEATEPSAIQLWAYDTIWAVATAVEKLGPSAGWTLRSQRSGNQTTELGRLGVRQTGQALLHAIRRTRFQGLAGEFRLVGGELQSPAFEIVNVDDKGVAIIGLWTPGVGIVEELHTVLWPGGGRTEAPKGWELPTGENKLHIAVPVKFGFNQFVKVETDLATGRPNVTGFCIDVFETALRLLPYPVAFEYKPVNYSYKSYDTLVYQVFLKNFDAVIGDTTILANRTQFVDFTMPYSESGVSMVVRVEEDKRTDKWIFLEPLTVDLWLGTLAFFVLTGFMVWLIEHRDNEEFPGRPHEQLGPIFYFTFSILVFSHKEKLTSNLTRFAVIICTFVVMILTSSYTASLTSMLTVQQLKPSVTNMDQLLSTGASIGYQDGSFTVAMLKKMGFKQSKLKGYSTADEYAKALTKGSANGGVDAVFDEIPYLKVFLSQHRAKFTMVGPTYKTDGFGFVFPQGSPLVPDISRAILQVTEGENMTSIEKKWFGEPNNSTSESGNIDSSSLTFQSFGGLFLITGMVSALALLIFLARFIYEEWGALKDAVYDQNSFLRKIVAVFMHYYNAGEREPLTFKKDDEYIVTDNEEIDQIQQNGTRPSLPELVGSHSPLSTTNVSDSYFASAEERMSSEEPNNPCNTRSEM